MTDDISELVRRAHEYHPQGTLYDPTGLIAPLANALERMRALDGAWEQRANEWRKHVEAMEAKIDRLTEARNWAVARAEAAEGEVNKWRDECEVEAKRGLELQEQRNQLQARAEAAEARLDPLKTLPPCMMPDGGDCCPQYSAQLARAEKAEAAFLRYVQDDNGCKVTGKPCRRPEQCGCHQETQP